MAMTHSVVAIIFPIIRAMLTHGGVCSSLIRHKLEPQRQQQMNILIFKRIQEETRTLCCVVTQLKYNIQTHYVWLHNSNMLSMRRRHILYWGEEM